MPGNGGRRVDGTLTDLFGIVGAAGRGGRDRRGVLADGAARRGRARQAELGEPAATPVLGLDETRCGRPRWLPGRTEVGCAVIRGRPPLQRWPRVTVAVPDGIRL